MIRAYRREAGITAAIAAIALILLVRRPDFYRPDTLVQLAVRVAPVLVASVGMTLVILARQIDISIGATVGVAAVVAGLAAQRGWPMPVVALAGVGTGAALGAINGGLVAGLGLPAIVATLATMMIEAEGLRYCRQGAIVNGLPDDFQWLGLGQASGRLAIVATGAAVFLAFAWGLRHLAVGRGVYATGSDPEAARLAGLRPRAVTFGVFVLMGALAGLASLLTIVQFPQVDPKTGSSGFEMQVIAGVVVGGVAIDGGRGRLLGVLLGVILLDLIGPGLTFLGVGAHWKRAIQGGIILVAVAAGGRGREAKR